MDYTKLDLNHKQELLCNARQLYLACQLLRKICTFSQDELINELWTAAYEQVNSLSETQINKMVDELELNRKSWNNRGLAVIIEPED